MQSRVHQPATRENKLNRIEQLRIFCMAAESANFREAAVRMGISPQVVTRAVKELEAAFGELLFHRNTRQVRITAFGERLMHRARLSINALDDLFLDNNHRNDEALSGVVRITAPSTLAHTYLLPVINRIARQHPDITLDLRLSEIITDAVDDKIDIGIRIGFLRDSRYVARAVAKVAFFVCASPDLIARHGAPTTLDELVQRPMSAMVDRNTGRLWPWYFADGQQLGPRLPAFVTDDPQTERRAVLDGIAFGQLGAFMAMPYLRDGSLVTVLQDIAPAPWDLYVYRPQRGPVPARVRLVFDALVETLSASEDFPLEPPTVVAG